MAEQKEGAMPVFEYNEFDEDGNWVDGPLHPDPGNPVEPGATAEEAAEADDGEDADDEDEDDDSFDPSDHTVEDVLAYVEEHPDEKDAVLAAEQAGHGRKTLIAALAD